MDDRLSMLFITRLSAKDTRSQMYINFIKNPASCDLAPEMARGEDGILLP
jgi:hypothetical protein